jgi:precorrin-6B methylase 2
MKTGYRFVGDDESGTLNQIIELSYAFQRSKVFLSACELNIFTSIGDDQRTAEEIASAINTDPRATDRLMNALVSMGLLQKYGSRFSNTKETRRYLVAYSQEFIGNFGHFNRLYHRWDSLTDSVREGHSVLPRITTDDESAIMDFIGTMHSRAQRNARIVIEQIYLTHTERVLDLGGGSGAYSMEFVKAKPGINVTVFDLPQVIPITRKYLTDYGFEDTVSTLPGDFFTDDIGSGYDLIFLSAIIHSHSIWENMDLMKKLYLAVNPGGQIVIHDFIISDDRTKPLYTALFALNMLVNTQSGDAYTETDVWIMLKEAWFKDIKFQETGFGTSIITAKK